MTPGFEALSWNGQTFINHPVFDPNLPKAARGRSPAVVATERDPAVEVAQGASEHPVLSVRDGPFNG